MRIAAAISGALTALLVATALAQTEAPAAPIDFTALSVPDSSQITVTWNLSASGGAPERFVVERSVAGPGGPWETVATLTPSIYNDIDTRSGETYWYRAFAENAAGRSEYSAVAEARANFPLQPPPGTVTPTPGVVLPDAGGGPGVRSGKTPVALVLGAGLALAFAVAAAGAARRVGGR